MLHLLLPSLLLAGAAPAAFDAAAFGRGAEAVGTRPSAAPAVRAEPSPSASFRLGAAFRAWRNANAAAEYDATHTTGDGGDEAVVAEDCTDERVAFAAMEAERGALALTVEAVAKAGAIEAGLIKGRAAAPPKECR